MNFAQCYETVTTEIICLKLVPVPVLVLVLVLVIAKYSWVSGIYDKMDLSLRGFLPFLPLRAVVDMMRLPRAPFNQPVAAWPL